ncbi:MAG: hypothetical protein HY075_02805, partial [Deltaproteobacteria bacterium]|nr:hypothetical protein [Deltaproteobacteria bacterium]
VAEDTFELLDPVPAELCHNNYCPRCFDSVVGPAKASYDETLERAKKVGFWSRGYRGNVPVIKKALRDIEVVGGKDRDKVVLKLGFKAASMGYNGLVRGELVSKKVRDHGYQKMVWSGSAIPCTVDEGKLEREEFREAHWRVLAHR